MFTCAACTLFAAKIERGITEVAKEAAHTVVWLKAKRVRDSSQATYASGLHRFLTGLEACGLAKAQILPRTPGAGVIREHVELFIGWAASRYKISTIRTTLNAVADWGKANLAQDSTNVFNLSTKRMLRSLEIEQGPTGLPVGKKGMTKENLGLLIAYAAHQARSHPHMASLYHRDIAMMVIGFFGLLRRSELIALRMGEVSFPGINGKKHTRLHIRKSKTDPAGVGAEILISGSTKDGWTLHDKIRRFYNLRLEMGAQPEDPFLVRWDLDRFSLSKHALQTGQALASRLKSLIRGLRDTIPGLNINPEAYGMHSLRRGGTVAAWAAGVDMEKIKAHGRWRSEAVRVYLTAGPDIKLSVTAAM